MISAKPFSQIQITFPGPRGQDCGTSSECHHPSQYVTSSGSFCGLQPEACMGAFWVSKLWLTSEEWQDSAFLSKARVWQERLSTSMVIPNIETLAPCLVCLFSRMAEPGATQPSRWTDSKVCPPQGEDSLWSSLRKCVCEFLDPHMLPPLK